MSNIYLLEPHTKGKVNLHTTYGDISIELWPKEAPKACRNFVQLCMEGYYDDTIFHRVVPGFIIQGGDPEGTGMGGESCYEDGKPFQDEFHSRLRFVRRGLVAMANSGVPNDNKSQFFITLDATMELQNKHTIFGKVAGDTIFNVLKIGSLEVDSDERPIYPPKVTGCTIVVNPFDDIVPRITRRELEAARLKELEAQKKVEKPKKMKKNVALLSFADDAPDMTADQGDTTIKKKIVSSHDVLEDDPTLSRDVDTSLVVSEDRKSKESKDRKSKVKDNKEKAHSPEDGEGADDDPTESAETFDQRMRDQIRENLRKSKLAKEGSSEEQVSSTNSASSADNTASTTLTESEKRRQEIQKLENDIRKMHNRTSGGDGDHETSKKSSKVSLLQQEREKYQTRGEKNKGTKRPSKSSKSSNLTDKDVEMLQKLSAFEAKVFSSAREPEPNPAPKRNDGPPCEIHGIPSCESCHDTTLTKKRKVEADEGGAGDEEGMIVDGEGDDSDNDIGWMQHKLVFEKDLKGKEVSLSAKRDDVNDYIVIDPRSKAPATTAALAAEQRMNLDKKHKRDSQYSQERSSGSGSGSGAGRRVYSSTSGESSSRQDRRNDRSYRDSSSSSSSYRKDDSRKSGYDRNDRYSRDSRDGRDSRDSRDTRDRDRRR
ncbi:Peptidyl-prolyl isomerase cwc27 [Mortierella sp. NVP85]|nr:Peptidyl-prolyl isomerase cwc27 [Mortierella sp. NVP85]